MSKHPTWLPKYYKENHTTNRDIATPTTSKMMKKTRFILAVIL